MDELLTAATRCRFLQSLIPIGARYYEHRSEFLKNNFCSFEPWHQAEFAFGSSDDKTVHSNYLEEESKEIVGNEFFGGVSMFDNPRCYRSPLIDRLRADRRELGFGSDYYSAHPNDNWQCWLSPCQRLERKLFAQNHPKHSEFLTAVKSKFNLERRKEISAHSTGFFPTCISSSTEICNRLGIMAKLKLEEFGFALRSNQRKKEQVVLSRILDKNLQLQLIFQVTLHGANAGSIYPLLFVCQRNIKEKSKKWSVIYSKSRYIEVRLFHSSPAFLKAYSQFSHGGDVEVIGFAILFLVTLEIEFILSCIDRYLLTNI